MTVDTAGRDTGFEKDRSRDHPHAEFDCRLGRRFDVGEVEDDVRMPRGDGLDGQHRLPRGWRPLRPEEKDLPIRRPQPPPFINHDHVVSHH
jgi:hypothetical protein